MRSPLPLVRERYLRHRLSKQAVARRVAQELQDGHYVNLGIGIPTLVPRFVPTGRDVIFHSENGILGMGPPPAAGEEDWDLIDAGKLPATAIPGAAFFAQDLSHAMARGGHLDVAVLGAFQVSRSGDLANWKVPGDRVAGVGGAMDMARARRIIVAMTQLAGDGHYKLVERCTYPLTAPGVVDLVVTDAAVIAVAEQQFELREVAPGLTPEDVQGLVAGELRLAPEIRVHGGV